MVGIAGGAEKCNYIVKELGFDSAIDYKSEDVRKSLRKHCPNGIDIYFDNVGGDILDAALTQLARGNAWKWSSAAQSHNTAIPHQSKDPRTISRFSPLIAPT